MSNPILTDMQAKMTKAVDHTLHEFSTIHTGKATPTMVESVMVEAYGSSMRLKECAAISTPDMAMVGMIKCAQVPLPTTCSQFSTKAKISTSAV